jgi:hypothetical protein
MPQMQPDRNAIILWPESPTAKRFQGNLIFVGEWLSLVEHLVRDQGVGGSNPLSPTNLIQNHNLAAIKTGVSPLKRGQGLSGAQARSF